MSRTSKRILFPISAAALAGAVLPVSASAPAASAADQAFGYSAVAVAAPAKVEFYEPTIPIPANPQFELEMGYTTVEADSGSSAGRASWLWPGDPIGEGAKTFGEQLHLPPQLFENGYPVQVNSGQPSGEPKQADEPFPGMVMRTSASDTKTIAQAGFSPDGQVQDGGKDGGDEGGDAGTPGVPGLPTPPGGSSATGMLQQFGQAITGGPATAAAQAPADDPGPGGTPGVPPQVAGLVDFEGYTSSSQSLVKDGKVTTISRTALGDVSLLGGMITLDGIVSTSTSGSNGSTNTAGGRSVLGGMTVNGQEFSFGPGGYTAGPQHGEAPAIPDQAAAALKQLGVTITLPKPDLHKKGDIASSTIGGLQVEIDAGKLMKQLHQLPIDDVINQLPNDPKELKSTLQAISGLSPRIVITLGTATTQVETVDAIDIPADVPDNDPGSTDGSASGGGAASGPSASGGAPSATAPGPAASGDAPSADGDLPPSQLTGSGLPPLYSIPGAILMAGIALAAVGGTWLRRIGVIALGGAGSCPHGLDSGLPDLRKA
ncbi:choice-of-anchor P family protein [Nocardioides aquiterrae]|uniref:Choice-of-anchor G family protein n=1 Tax=Nocardioides aquiterrae TaxID=203799 RepID=A0ABP4FE14_9ACTN